MNLWQRIKDWWNKDKDYVDIPPKGENTSLEPRQQATDSKPIAIQPIQPEGEKVEIQEPKSDCGDDYDCHLRG